MKCTIIIGVMAAAILLAGCGKKSTASGSSGATQVVTKIPGGVILSPVHTSSGSPPPGIVVTTNYVGNADLESVTNTVRSATSDPIVSMKKIGNDGTTYVVSTDSALKRSEYDLIWSGSNWNLTLMAVAKH